MKAQIVKQVCMIMYRSIAIGDKTIENIINRSDPAFFLLLIVILFSSHLSLICENGHSQSILKKEKEGGREEILRAKKGQNWKVNSRITSNELSRNVFF